MLAALSAAGRPAKAAMISDDKKSPQQVPHTTTTLFVIQGSGELQSQQTAMTVNAPQALYFVWSTKAAGAAGGNWQVTTTNSANQAVVVAQGQTGKSFGLPANAFLKATPPPSPGVKYYITFTPTNAQQQAVDQPSAPVMITQVQAGPSMPIHFGRNEVFPELELVHYHENIGAVPLTQLQFATAVVKILAINHGKVATDPLRLSVMEANGLMRQTSQPAQVPALNPGASMEVTVNLTASLEAPKSQLPEAEQYKEWKQRYQIDGGVDLRATMDWSGPQASAPMNDHIEVYLYRGRGDSTACQDGKVDLRNTPPAKPVCDGNVCVSIDQLLQNVRQRLDCRVVGYSLYIGRTPTFGAVLEMGAARTGVNPPQAGFTPQTKMTVASVSKMVTTLAAVRVLAKNNVDIKSPIGPHLPKDWNVSPTVAAITFQQLLSHTSGIKDYGNNAQDYNTLKNFFTQTVNPAGQTTCQSSAVNNPPNPINIHDHTPCYSNYNFSIFRILLPLIDHRVTGDPGGTEFANQYVALVDDNVFKPVGIQSVFCKPPQGVPYAIGYKSPGNTTGWDWGDLTPNCGAAGWYLSVDDMAKVLLSLNMQDGKILSEDQFQSMETLHLGWDQLSNNGIRYLEKNGAFGGSAGQLVNTSVAMFGPSAKGQPGASFIGILFLDSDISGEPGVLADTVLRDAVMKAKTP
jgi:CubicO group peptidase (beta-lactamase class C family)